MTVLDLDDDEIMIVSQCLWAAVAGPFFDDSEFQTLIGVPREEVRHLAATWPPHDADRPGLRDILIGVLNNLLGYPHGEEEGWRRFITVEPAVVSAILDKLLNVRPPS